MPLTHQLQTHILVGGLVHKSQEKGLHCTALYFSEAQLVTAQQPVKLRQRMAKALDGM